MSLIERVLLRLAAMLPHAMTLENDAYRLGFANGYVEGSIEGRLTGIKEARELQERMSA